MQFVTFDVRQNNAEELNKFLKSHRILSISTVFNQLDGSWSFCIEYIPDESFLKDKEKHFGRIDYREKLSAEDFAKFRALRDTRKALSEELNVPAYVIFVDTDLLLLLDKDITKEALKEISGFGEKKFEKYGQRFLELWDKYKQLIPSYLEKEKELRAKNEKVK